MDKTYASALDELLVEFDKVDTSNRITRVSLGKLRPFISAHEYRQIVDHIIQKYQVDEREVDLMSLKLQSDGMLLHDEKENLYRILFKGIDFLKEYNGQGYSQTKINRQNEDARIVRNEK